MKIVNFWPKRPSSTQAPKPFSGQSNLPTKPLQCFVCSGKTKVRSRCDTCDSKGYVNAPGHTTFYACHHCGNLRCVHCGGVGLEPQFQSEPQHLT